MTMMSGMGADGGTPKALNITAQRRDQRERTLGMEAAQRIYAEGVALGVRRCATRVANRSADVTAVFRLLEAGGNVVGGAVTTSLWPDSEGEVADLERLEEEELSDSWKPIRVRPHPPGRVPLDFHFVVRQLPVFSDRVECILPSGLLDAHGARFGLSCPLEMEYFVYRPNRRDGLLDERLSRIDWFPRKTFIRRIERFAFTDTIDEVPMFRIPTCHDVFVTSRFVDSVEASELTGFRFEQVWST